MSHRSETPESTPEEPDPWIEVPLTATDRPLCEAARQLIDQGRQRFSSLWVFDFVPCNYEVLWNVLDSLPRGRFCEYGSGWGIATGLAELLGFDAWGIELSGELATASRQLLSEHGLGARIEQGDYLQRQDQADIYFTYAWPSHMRLIEAHFVRIAPSGSRLLYCHGQDDIRCRSLRPYELP